MNSYEMMTAQAKALAESEPHYVPLMSNVSALIYDTLEDLNWAGFYIVRAEQLVLGPFQGKVACIHIAKGKGVCGTAFSEDCTQRVENVHDFPGHIACDSASNSELVIPIHRRDGSVGAVLDLDSPTLSRFSEEDQKGLEELVAALETYIEF